MENHIGSSAAGQAAPPPSEDNPSPFLGLVINPDGTVTRPFFPTSPPNGDPTAAVLSADVPLDARRGTSLRLYAPRFSGEHEDEEKKNKNKLTTVVFFHGGGFVFFSAATVPYHLFCERLAGELPAVVVSVDYRLAPEHRLPAAYEDAADALRWLQTQAAAADPAGREPLLRRADLSRCFLFGSSAGANIAYHLALEVSMTTLNNDVVSSSNNDDRNPNFIIGIIAHQPFFSGTRRMKSDMEGWNDPVLPLYINDMMWELSLPMGAMRDHEFAHPMFKKHQLPKFLVTGNIEDPLIDWQQWFVDELKKSSANVIAHLDEKGTHAVELFSPEAAIVLLNHVKAFIASI